MKFTLEINMDGTAPDARLELTRILKEAFNNKKTIEWIKGGVVGCVGLYHDKKGGIVGQATLIDLTDDKE